MTKGCIHLRQVDNVAPIINEPSHNLTIFRHFHRQGSQSPHSHSIVSSHGNTLIFRREFFQFTRKNRLPDPSEICALDFK
jgi:hypothetical protein